MYLDKHREHIIDAVKQGLSDRTIAEQLRVSPSTVRYWRERNGVIRERRARRRPPAGDSDESKAD